MAALAYKWQPWTTEFGIHVGIDWVLLMGRAISLLIPPETLGPRAWSITRSRRPSWFGKGPPVFRVFPVRFNPRVHRCTAENSGAGASLWKFQIQTVRWSRGPEECIPYGLRPEVVPIAL
jgi:hypothetical protein